MEGYCESHVALATDIATIKSDIQYIRNEVCKHIKEGEEKGGYRDRLVVVELAVVSLTKEIAALKTAKWITAMVGGAIGGLIAIALPETIVMIIKTLFHG
jgi:hypothetical protein